MARNNPPKRIKPQRQESWSSDFTREQQTPLSYYTPERRLEDTAAIFSLALGQRREQDRVSGQTKVAEDYFATSLTTEVVGYDEEKQVRARKLVGGWVTRQEALVILFMTLAEEFGPEALCPKTPTDPLENIPVQTYGNDRLVTVHV
jgi:hypothetical protein